MKRLILFTLAYFVLSLIFVESCSNKVLAKETSQTDKIDKIIVKYRQSGIKSSQEDLFSKSNVEKSSLKLKNTYVLKVDKEKIKEKIDELKKDENVEYAEPDYFAQVTEFPNDPFFPEQWGLEKILAPYAWDQTHGTSSAIIAVLDTGIDPNHSDLAGKIVKRANFTTDPDGDVYGHGTHVAGIASAITNNGIGVAGMGYDTSLMSVKVMNDTGGGYYSWIIDGIIWATDNGAKVINISLGAADAPSTALEDAINYAWNKGVVVVAAAGNNGQDQQFYPAYYTNTIATAATYETDYIAGFSNFGSSWVDVAAPGDYIYSTYKGNTYSYMSGTSMASPFVAGLAGLIAGQHPEWTNTQIRNQIESTADKISGTGTLWSSGRINACKAVGCSYTPQPLPVGDGLLGDYFKNKTLTGSPALRRVDPTISFNWGTNSPNSVIPRDNFSVRWTGSIMANKSGLYNFYLKIDDGGRLWMDNQLLIDKWKNQSATEYATNIRLIGGKKYSIKIEYYDNYGNALAQLSWESSNLPKQIVPQSQLFSDQSITPTPTISPTPTVGPTPIISPTPNPILGDGLTGSYFKDKNLTTFGFTRKDPLISFVWGTSSPLPGLFPTDNFSVRWTGFVLSKDPGTYTFYTKTDDGVRLWIDNNLIINKWINQASVENKATITLDANKKYSVKIEYYDNWGNATMQFFWSGPNIVKQIIPQSQLFSN